MYPSATMELDSTTGLHALLKLIVFGRESDNFTAAERHFIDYGEAKTPTQKEKDDKTAYENTQLAKPNRQKKAFFSKFKFKRDK